MDYTKLQPRTRDHTLGPSGNDWADERTGWS